MPGVAHPRRLRRRVVSSVLAATLAGGCLWTSCTGILWQATVDGTKDYVLGLLDPAALAEAFLDNGSD